MTIPEGVDPYSPYVPDRMPEWKVGDPTSPNDSITLTREKLGALMLEWMLDRYNASKPLYLTLPEVAKELTDTIFTNAKAREDGDNTDG